ncbi:dihydroxyacetone kinase subunit DhaL [Streptantibioticus cattleyicolor]|uniref:Dihydroxyacetone kinase, L subunit n=1 Tax=Streptantibioticus cattleyicolor (strain ATCC 35852 / DSM 46488 / JCM 4925 / NBRC 14057 / NRRL 8057) TaxID=1003195 RepID=F8JNP4_STREN|nr:dihydroxyacetone kinase subunit DhaL [Streptantibioticus cattleyicolor]AEW98986.1 dihydroxyacetone kinase, L subunit [Streptantibioticus cattleyicolor NRRL 8057 = DSM 46488]CCB71971.1 putative dihydroxyacetone kinase subunit 2 [Streptantibioticus cattleyicolor NRRL 8057 = DSM 46488]
MEFDGGFTAGWMRRFAASAEATRAELTALDQQVGDGDFGINLTTGLSSVVAALDALPVPSGQWPAAAPLEAAAGVFLDDVGGTSGPLFGLVLQELAVAAADVGPRLTTAALTAGTAAGLAAVQRVGEAVPGDKTLVDALTPAVERLQRSGAQAPPGCALRAAADGAWEGVLRTARLRARRGRASYLGDRAVGVPDPGAVGVGLLFASAGRPVASLAPFVPRGAQPAVQN